MKVRAPIYRVSSKMETNHSQGRAYSSPDPSQWTLMRKGIELFKIKTLKRHESFAS